MDLLPSSLMTMCGGNGMDVAHDALAKTTGAELAELDCAFSTLDKAMNAAMGAFLEVLHTLSKVGRLYNNLSIACPDEVQARLQALHLEIQNIQEQGLYAAFNQDVITGTLQPLAPIKADVKTGRKNVESSKKAFTEYEVSCNKVELKEADLAKKGKPLSGNSEYQKRIRERDAKKVAYEKERLKCETHVQQIRAKMGATVTNSSLSFADATASFFTFIGTVMESFGTGTATPRLAALKNSYTPPTVPPVSAELLSVPPPPCPPISFEEGKKSFSHSRADPNNLNPLSASAEEAEAEGGKEE